MQTSIEWLYQEIIKKSVNDPSHNILSILEQAKEMHKQEINNAFESGEDNIDNDGCAINKNGAESYYNETFKKD